MADDIVDRLREAAQNAPNHEILREAADNIEFLRKQSRGHFEAMTAVLRDGVEAVMPETSPKKAN